jgi:hypothetical protein
MSRCLLACPVRRWFQEPGEIVAPYARQGMVMWLGGRDSNPDKQIQSLPSYR